MFQHRRGNANAVVEFSIPDLQVTREFEHSSLWSGSMSIFANGHGLATADYDANTVKLWNLTHGGLWRELGSGGIVYIHPDQRNLYVHDDGDDTISAYDLKANRKLHEYSVPEPVLALELIGTNPGWMLTVHKYGFMLWDVEARDRISDYRLPEDRWTDRPTCVATGYSGQKYWAICPNMQYMVCTIRGGPILDGKSYHKIFSLPGFKELASFEVEDHPHPLFTSDAKHLLLVFDQELQVLNVTKVPFFLATSSALPVTLEYSSRSHAWKPSR